MSDNPFAQFASNPFAQFAASPPEITMFDGIDLGGDVPTVREAINKLPPARRKEALAEWAKTTVAKDNRKTGGQGFLRDVNNYMETLARGTPIGSWGDEIDAGLKAAAHSVTGGTIGAPYDETLAYNRARQKSFDDNNFKTSLALKVAGGVASAPFSPALRAAQGASMVSRIGAGATTGAAYGALYGAGEGEDNSSRNVEALKGVTLGAGLGAVAPVIAQGLGNATKYVADKYRGMPDEFAQRGITSRNAIDKVSRAAVDDGVFPGAAGSPPTQAYANQVARLGPEGMLGDMGVNLGSQVQGLTTQRGPGQTILRNAIEGRARGAAGLIANDTTATLGAPRNLVVAEQEAIRESKAIAGPLYDQFYRMQIPVTDTLVSLLQRVPQSVYQRAQQLATAEGVDLARTINTGRGVDLIKRGLDDAARAAGRGTNEERVFSSLARDLRNEVDTLISPANPAMSPWSQARAAAGDGFQYREALEMGRQAFSRGTHPDQMAADIAGMNALQRGAYQEGARGQIRDIMGNATSASSSPAEGLAAATAARNALGSNYARQKLDLITQGRQMPGRAPAGQLINRLDAETVFANTRNNAWMGTQTAARTAAQKEFPNAATRREAASEMGKKGPWGMATEAVWRMANALRGGHLDVKNLAEARDAARLLSAQDRDRDALVQALMAHAQGRAISARGRDAISRVLEEAANTPRNALISVD